MAESTMKQRILLLVLSLATVSAGRRAAAQANPAEGVNPPAANAKSTPTQSETPATTLNTAPQVDVAKLMNTAVANIQRNDILARNYAFQKSIDETWYD